MVIITGSVRALPGNVERVRELSLEHVHRSRLEAGCLLHSVHQDLEDPQRFVFIEQWRDADAVRAHFAVPASVQFVRDLRGLSDGATEIAIYETTPLDL
ncbi:MAG: putative quinol monooxygenase [Ilumatobacteraceae bacterium]